MKKQIYFLLALMILAEYQSTAIAAPKHRPVTKADKAQHYTVSMSLTGSNAVQERVRLTLAGHTVMSDTLTRSEGPSIQASDLKPGVYTATVTLIGTLVFDANHAVVPTTDPVNGYTFDLQTARISPSYAIKIISVGNSFSPPVASEIGGQATSLIWEWDGDHRLEAGAAKDPSWKNVLAHTTINNIGDTCKIVFYVGPDAASYIIKSPPPVKITPPSSLGDAIKPFSEVLTDKFKRETATQKRSY